MTLAVFALHRHDATAPVTEYQIRRLCASVVCFCQGGFSEMEKITEANIKGKGVLTVGSLAAPAAHHDVTYNLDVYQTVIRVPNMDDPNAAIGGLKEVRGRIAPVYFTGLNDVKLQLQDGGRMNLIVSDTGGAVVGGFDTP